MTMPLLVPASAVLQNPGSFATTLYNPCNGSLARNTQFRIEKPIFFNDDDGRRFRPGMVDHEDDSALQTRLEMTT